MRKLALLSVLCLVFTACGKDNSSGIPVTTVQLTLPMTDPRISRLNSIGSAVYLNLNDGYTGTVAGLLLYHGNGGIVAFDRCSSYNPSERNAVVSDGSGFAALDAKSGSKFSLEDGSPVKAPATKSLRAYSAYIDGSRVLHVTN